MPLDEAAFRETLSLFPSGVAIVTAVDRQGVPRGLTTRSLVALEGDPPLMVIAVDRTSRTLVAIHEAAAFVVNILSREGEALSTLFATKADDKFARVRWVPSAIAHGAPVLTEATVAVAECLVESEVDAGDHIVITGRVEAGHLADGEPLIYYRRSYTGLEEAAPEGD